MFEPFFTIKPQARRPQLRVLYMSGYTNDEVVRHGVILAHDLFLQKPFTPGGLVAKVRAAFAGNTELATPSELG